MKNRIVTTAMAGIFAIGTLIGCDTARNLVEPIDNTPIETSGETNFNIRIKPTTSGYETTLSLSDLIIYDTNGNQLPPITIDDIVVNVPKQTPAEPVTELQWLKDVIAKTDTLQPNWHCDNHTEFIEDDWSVANFHHHSIYHSHRHNHWTSGHSHDEGNLVEHAGSILEAQSNEEHDHVIFIKHSHQHEPFNPPKPFHTHKCK